MKGRIIPPGMLFVEALRLGYTGEIRMPGYLAWIRTLPCRNGHGGKTEASHPNFFKSQTRKGPDPLALPECRVCHGTYEDRGAPDEQARLAAAALYMLQAIHEGRLRWGKACTHVEQWTPVEHGLPDDDLVVMVALKNSDEPTWLGYHDADGWFSASDGAPITKMVTHWQPTPEGPRA